MRKSLGVILLFSLLLVLQGYAKAPSIPALVLQARYVALGYETAEGFIAETDFRSFASTKVQPDDRQAIANIYDVLTKWKRYTITINPADADMLIAVRTGRVASGTGGIRVGTGGIDPTTGRRTSSSIGPVFGAEAGPADDYLAVYQANAGCALHPRSRVRLAQSKLHTSIQGSGGDPTFPAQWLYGLCRALPGDEFLVDSVAAVRLSPTRQLDTCNGCQDHTVLPYAHPRRRLA